MRIRLLFTLALFLLGGATPLYASLGVAPPCPPLASQGARTKDVKSPLTAGGQVIPNYDAEDRDYHSGQQVADLVSSQPLRDGIHREGENR